jgi:hypothetical protein
MEWKNCAMAQTLKSSVQRNPMNGRYQIRNCKNVIQLLGIKLATSTLSKGTSSSDFIRNG